MIYITVVYEHLGMVQDVFDALFICQHSFYLDYGNLYESWCTGYGSDYYKIEKTRRGKGNEVKKR